MNAERNHLTKVLLAVYGAFDKPETDALRRPPWRGAVNKYAGHCYVASEVLYHALGGKERGWKPMYLKHEGAPHWYIQHRHGLRIDVTANQFETRPDYDKAVAKGFLTKHPSKRARQLAAVAGIKLHYP